MDLTLLDNPFVTSILFYPRQDQPGTSRLRNVHDGTIPVEEGAVLGYRLYVHTPTAPVIVYFHGNGEIASDHDYYVGEYFDAGTSLIVIDYRGYGWSTGTPKISALIADVAPVVEALPGILAGAGITSDRLVLMGRSLGSVPTIHAAQNMPDRFKGLIIESGFAHAIPLLARLGIPAEMLANLPDPIGNARKIAEVRLPLLVIHGERDTLIPVANGQALYDASPAEHKCILRVPGAGHNDLLMVALDLYFAAIADFLRDVAPPPEGSS